MRLSKNFSTDEFSKVHSSQLDPQKIFLMESLCQNILEPLREYFGCPIKIFSGYRSAEDFHRLKAQGYHPSETSDHYFGDSVPLNSIKKISKYGAIFKYSVGAVDIGVATGTALAFRSLQSFFIKEEGVIALPDANIRVGQFILERHRDFWIHVSNPAQLVYSLDFCKRYLLRTPFMYSPDGGVSYQPIV